MKIPKLKKFEPCEIFWLDSMGESCWKNTSQVQHDDRDLEHVTAGYFLEQSKQAVTVVGSRSLYEIDGQHNVRDLLSIPKVAITKMRRLYK